MPLACARAHKGSPEIFTMGFSGAVPSKLTRPVNAPEVAGSTRCALAVGAAGAASFCSPEHAAAAMESATTNGANALVFIGFNLILRRKMVDGRWQMVESAAFCSQLRLGC